MSDETRDVLRCPYCDEPIGDFVPRNDVERLVGALREISRRRKTYEGKPCKNIEADIADEALANFEKQKDTI